MAGHATITRRNGDSLPRLCWGNRHWSYGVPVHLNGQQVADYDIRVRFDLSNEVVLGHACEDCKGEVARRLELLNQ